jgi:hypothetical protein
MHKIPDDISLVFVYEFLNFLEGVHLQLMNRHHYSLYQKHKLKPHFPSRRLKNWLERQSYIIESDPMVSLQRIEHRGLRRKLWYPSPVVFSQIMTEINREVKKVHSNLELFQLTLDESRIVVSSEVIREHVEFLRQRRRAKLDCVMDLDKGLCLVRFFVQEET